MTGLIVLGVIVLIIVGIMLIPVGVDYGYEDGELHVAAKVCGIKLQLFPKAPQDESKPKKEKKPKRLKKKKLKAQGEGDEAQPKKKKSKLSFSKDELLGLLTRVLGGFGKFGRKFKVDRFYLRYIAAGTDPYATAVNYAYVNAALAGLAPICAKRFKVKECQVSTDVDFIGEKMTIDLGMAISIRIGQILGTVFSILFGALEILIKNKLRLSRENRKNRKNGPAQAETPEQITDKIEENIQAEERMEANG